MNLRFWLTVGVAAVAVACVHHDPTERPIRLATQPPRAECAQAGVHTQPDTCEIRTGAAAPGTQDTAAR
jgi:hypothetical protein